MSLFGFVLLAMIAFVAWRWALTQQESHDAEDTVIDASDRFGDSARRKNSETSVPLSPSAIDHPVTAAAILIRMVIGEDTWPMVQGRVRASLADVSTPQDAEGAIQYTERAAKESLIKDQSVTLLIESLREKLTLDERHDLIRMLEDAAQSGDHEVQARASREAIRLIN